MSIKEFDESSTIINPDLPTDALSSKQFNTIVEVVSEGEIEGFATASRRGIASNNAAYKTAALTDIFLNKTPVLNVGESLTDPAFLSKVQNPSDDDFNFKNVGFDFRLGTSNQTFIDGIKSTETEIGVSTNVTTTQAATHTVLQSNIDAVRVTLRFPSIQKFEDNGNISGSEIELKIKTIENNGTTQTPITDTVKGRTTNSYFRDYLIKFTSTTSFPVQIRVERVTEDSTDSKLINAFSFHTVTEIIFQQQTYPNTAHLALRLNAEQFPRIPRRVYKIRGIKVSIPNNATVNNTDGSITYSGTWNGTFDPVKRWTSDPAWILYDLLTNDRYGCSIPAADINKFTFKTVSEYCSTQIDDGSGTGSTEPRFSCNVNITQPREAFKLINEISSVMQVMPFYSSGTIAISQDAPSDPIFLFNASNVTEDGFLYAGSSNKTRNTVINVSYFDMQTQDLDVETVEASTAIQNKYGVVVKSINAFACTSRGQARRLGKWFLYNEQNSGETCTFSTTIDAGVSVRCGHIIEISDPTKAGVRRGGKLKAASGTTITLDDFQNTDIPAVNNTPTISCMLPDNTLETRAVTNVSNNVLTIQSAFTTDPNPNAVYILQTPNLETTKWRVISVKENDNMTFTITALLHNNDKYAFVEDGTPLPTKNTTILTAILDPPSGLNVTENIVLINNKAVSKLILDWETQGGASKYEVQYRFNNGPFTKIETLSSDAEIINNDAGVYEIRVFSFNGLGEPSKLPATTTFNAVGKTAPPSDITGLTYEPITDKLIRLRWDAVPDIDVKAGGSIFVRHSPKTDGTGTFQDATDLIQALSGATTSAELPLLEGEYILTAQDDGSRFSSGETSLVIDLPDAQPKLLVQTRREDQDNPKFQGAKDKVGFDSGTNAISLTGAGLFDDVLLVDNVSDFDDLGNVHPEGTYEFNDILDLGAIYSLDLRKHILSNSVYASQLIDSRGIVDTYLDFDGTSSLNTNAEIFVQTSQDGSNYGSYQKFANGTFKGRTFKFKCVLTTTDPSQDINVTQLGYTAEFQRREEIGSQTSSGNTQVTFANSFFTGTTALLGANSNLPSIGITAFDMQSGDFYEITNRTSTGFQINFKNSSGSSVSRQFNFIAVGFGKG